MLANKPYVIGLTGGIGCGKSEAAQYLKTLGAAHVDADEISRALTQPGGAALPEIRRVFGEAAFNEDGSLDRANLGKLVFGNEPARRALEGIIHPLVQREMLARMDAAGQEGAAVVILDVPLLFETGMERYCDEVWCAYVPKAIQLARLMKRSGLTRKEAAARIAAQLPNAERRRRADRVISTAGTKEESAAEIIRRYDALQARLKAGQGECDARKK